jgi:glycosyltransferase involved in cell wall biosynthesis
VIVPVHNRAGLVVQTLESVAAQTYRPIELIVVDDGSTDGTVEVVDRWAQTRAGEESLDFRLIRQANAGAPAARNRGMELAKGEWIQFLDSDDLLSPDKIATQVVALHAAPHAALAYCQIRQLEVPDRIIYGQGPIDHRRFVIKQLVSPALQTAGPLLRRVWAERIGPMRCDLALMDDWEYFSRAALLGALPVFVSEGAVFLRLEDSGPRLSWRGESDRLTNYIDHRLGHLVSMHDHAGRWLIDREFSNTLAWQLIAVVGMGLKLGWRGDYERPMLLAAHVSAATLPRFVARLVLRSARTAGPVATGWVVSTLPWLYWRMKGLEARLRRLKSSVGSRSHF